MMTNTNVSRSPLPATPDLPVITTRHPWLWALGWALIPVLLTSVGFGYAQSQHLDDGHTYLAVATAVTIAALAGLLRMLRSHKPLSTFGLRRPAPGTTRPLLAYAPLALGPILIAATTGIAVDRALIPGFLWLAAAVACSEEIWFRGIVLATLRARSQRTAILGSAALFAVLHLANLLGSASPLYAGLQLAFAALFGLVAALVVTHTGSLWPVIAWHFIHDAITYLGGDALTATTLGVLAIECAVLTAYAVLLWRRLPA